MNNVLHNFSKTATCTPIKNRMVENYFITMKFLARLHLDIGHLLNIVMNSS